MKLSKLTQANTLGEKLAELKSQMDRINSSKWTATEWPEPSKADLATSILTLNEQRVQSGVRQLLAAMLQEEINTVLSEMRDLGIDDDVHVPKQLAAPLGYNGDAKSNRAFSMVIDGDKESS